MLLSIGWKLSTLTEEWLLKRKLKKTETAPLPNAVFDEGSNFLIYATLLGIKAAAADDDDLDVDLFGEETEKENKAAEERATAIKAFGKKKECSKKYSAGRTLLGSIQQVLSAKEPYA